MVAVLVGGTTPSLVYTVKYAADVSATGTEVVTSGSTVTNTTTGNITTTFSNGVIPADNFVWVSLSTITGAPTSFHLTLHA